MQLGFIGVPFSGKSTLFELLTYGHFDGVRGGGAEYHRGKVTGPDERVDRLSAIYQPKKTTHTDFQCIDVKGLAGKKQRDQSAKYLEAVRQTDGVVLVLRAFDGIDAEGNPSSIDPPAEIDSLEEELIFADLVVLENRLEKVRHYRDRGAPQFDPREYEILEKGR